MRALAPSLTVVLGLVLVSLPAAGQVGGQQNRAELDAISWDTVPEELPGAFHGTFLVRIVNTGGACACAQTQVSLNVTFPPALTQPGLSLTDYTIDWTDQANAASGTHTQPIELRFHMQPFSRAQRASVEVHVTAQTDTPASTVHDARQDYQIPLPGGPGANLTTLSLDPSQDPAALEVPGDAEERKAPLAPPVALLLGVSLAAGVTRRM